MRTRFAQLVLVGPNSVEDAPRLSALRLLLRQFESPLVLILAFAAAISLALQQWVDAAIILAIVLGSSLLRVSFRNTGHRQRSRN